MQTIVLEHSFPDREFDIERYRSAQDDGAWCLDIHGVKHVRSYLTPDRRRMVCIFEAPDAEAVRKTAVQLGFDYDAVWPATVID